MELPLLYYSLLLILVIYVVHKHFRPPRQSRNSPFFSKGCASPEETKLLAGVVDMLLKHQESFNFEKATDKYTVLKNREDAYKQTAAAAGDFFAKHLLTTQDLVRGDSEKIFLYHRILGQYDIDSGLLIRLTVNANLFGGSIANMGTEKQKLWLQDTFDKGELGCFLLTESGAGVLSGLVVTTEAVWTPEGNFILNSPDPVERSKKKWISQGMMARWGVVIANLILDGKSKGPHAWLVDMKSPGVVVEDMPRKTVFNSLDTCYVTFNNVILPKDSMLSGISYVGEDGDYRLVDPKKPFEFVHVSQRLLSGRICLSGFALGRLYKILQTAEGYCEGRVLPLMGSKKQMSLAELPVVHDAFYVSHCLWKVFNCYIQNLESKFTHISEITPQLVHEISCAKAEISEFCGSTLKNLKNRVGAYSLMEDGAFNLESEVFQLIRFAEGDVGILQQKMARDLLKTVTSSNALAKKIFSFPYGWRINSGISRERIRLGWAVISLSLTMFLSSKEELVETWLRHHSLVNFIARLCALITIYDNVYPKLKGTEELNVFRNYMYSIHRDPCM